MTTIQIIALAIFLITMAVIMTEKIDITLAAVTGAVLMILFRVLTVDSCFAYIDINTLGMLIGMMLFVAVVRNSGIFEYIAIRAAKMAKGKPWAIMASFMVVTAVLSAFLDNVTTVLLVGPMTLAITDILRVNPVPYFITQILASNIGGTATLIGDPPNIMIGSAADLSFLDFAANTGVAIVFVMIATVICFYFIYGRKLHVEQKYMDQVMLLDENKAIKDVALMKKSIIMLILIVLAFVFHSALGLESSIIALSAAAIMMLIGKQDVEETISGVEWPTIIFFTGLFIVVGGIQEVGIIDILATKIMAVTSGHMAATLMVILWGSALLSSVINNIPYVATMLPLILTMQAGGMDIEPLCWALSLGACLGGNGTLIGASANVVLSGISTKHGHPITFKSYLKIGFPLMLVSIIVSTVFILVRYS